MFEKKNRVPETCSLFGPVELDGLLHYTLTDSSAFAADALHYLQTVGNTVLSGRVLLCLILALIC